MKGLALVFGATPGFRMKNLQLRWDLYQTQRREAEQLARIAPRQP